MPEDLDANVVGPYTMPDTARRRRAGLVYLVAALVVALGIWADLPTGMWLTVAGFTAIALYHLLAGVRLQVREQTALDIANQATDFPIGHASAALGFDGFLARPVSLVFWVLTALTLVFSIRTLMSAQLGQTTQ